MIKQVVCCDKCAKELTSDEEKNNKCSVGFSLNPPVFCNKCFKKISPLKEEVIQTRHRLNELEVLLDKAIRGDNK